jgi:flagellar basal-body rod modification protein FlgD
MSSISATDDLFATLGLSREPEQRSGNDATKLGLETFLKLMVTQLNNQDPFEPMDNGQFLGQIAQFGTVSGLNDLNEAFSGLSANLTSGQALQAGGLVGRRVLVPLETGNLESGEALRGQVELNESAADVVVRVSDTYGQLVRELHVGPHEAGPIDFAWDGLTDTGDYAPPGRYQVRVEAERSSGAEVLQTRLYATVDSVSLGGSGGLTLNLAGLGPVPFNNVNEIH